MTAIISPCAKPNMPLDPPERLCFCIDARKWTIRRQIMTGILLVAAAVLAVVAAASVINVFVLGGSTSRKAVAALETQIRTNALNFSKANAQQVQQTLQRRAALADTLAIASSQMFAAHEEGRWLLGNHSASLWSQDLCEEPSATPTGFADDGTPLCQTTAMSSYYLPKTTNKLQTSSLEADPAAPPCGLWADDPAPLLGYDMRPADGCASLAERLGESCPCPCVSAAGCAAADVASAARHEVDVSAHLDRHFIAFFDSLPDVSLMYVGFEATGLFREFPGNNGLPQRMTYDPRKRPWYVAARGARRLTTETGHHLGETIISAPYAGATKGMLMVTVAKAVYHQDAPSKLRCVIGIDITLAAMQENIQRKVSFLQSGYVALIESVSRDPANAPDSRIVVAHKAYDSDDSGGGGARVLDVRDVEPDLVDNHHDVFEALGAQSAAGGAIEDYERGGVPYLLAHSSITTPAQYTVLIFIPESEALAAVPALESDVRSTETEVSVTVVFMATITGAIVFGVVAVLSSRISAPVASMVNVANAIVGGAAEMDFGKNVTTSHIEKLQRFAFPDGGGAAFGDSAEQREVRNEMVMLSRSFLEMTQGLKKDTNKTKQRVIQPENPFHVAREHSLVSSLGAIARSRGWRTSSTAAAGAGTAVPVVLPLEPITHHAVTASVEATAPPMAAEAGASAIPTAPIIGDVVGKIKCSACGRKCVTPGSKFCPECGAPVR